MNTFRKTRIVYMGTPEFAVAPLKALIEAGYNVVGVVTVADKPSGRGLKVNESAVKKFAVEQGIPVLQPVKLKDPEFQKQLADFKADLFVVVAFRMLPESVNAEARHFQPPCRPPAPVQGRSSYQLGCHQWRETHRSDYLHDRQGH